MTKSFFSSPVKINSTPNFLLFFFDEDVVVITNKLIKDYYEDISRRWRSTKKKYVCFIWLLNCVFTNLINLFLVEHSEGKIKNDDLLMSFLVAPCLTYHIKDESTNTNCLNANKSKQTTKNGAPHKTSTINKIHFKIVYDNLWFITISKNKKSVCIFKN